MSWFRPRHYDGDTQTSRAYPWAMPDNTPPVSADSGRDPLSRMRTYQIAAELLSESWDDAEKLRHNQVTQKLSAQLYAAVASISANLGEGYSRSSGRDRARIFEYALGSVRESMVWYRAAEPVLGTELTGERLDKLEEIRRLLLAIIPRERGRLIRPSRGIRG
jgi:four helix bundle protein